MSKTNLIAATTTTTVSSNKTTSKKNISTNVSQIIHRHPIPSHSKKSIFNQTSSNCSIKSLSSQPLKTKEQKKLIINNTHVKQSIKTQLSISQNQNQGNSAHYSLFEQTIFRDPCFDFLWRMQKQMQPFAETMGGRTTWLRSLRKKCS
ncbi:unnamed protein product [Rotaria magnacalcarata]|uniref:Uncharacterized protein n=1 Tax=Rotaria magnacalcarata TaxID=392030 RepID=A0A816PC68_9BILA|nr:unnamed protein product [Rotaria magnacalcarata]CAF1520459.1 unnamed protein product [Rotaria magnacalcarata]CAF2046906.1 unnamed protein product [Rotaria magnacalcarata]CAF3756386.1 unnamed protein product [Rotaria magnacalcarata]CAF3810007.1 unnamed protein product [Rotaria magnacalcarata]